MHTSHLLTGNLKVGHIQVSLANKVSNFTASTITFTYCWFFELCLKVLVNYNEGLSECKDGLIILSLCCHDYAKDGVST